MVAREAVLSSGRERVRMAHEWFQQKAPRERLLELRKHALRAPITYRLICKYEGYAAGGAAYRAQAAAALKVNQRAPLWPADRSSFGKAARLAGTIFIGSTMFSWLSPV